MSNSIRNKVLFIGLIASLNILPAFMSGQENLDAAINTLTDQINKYMVEQKKTKIAIIPFPDLEKQKVTVLGSFIAEELTTNLFSTGKFKIVERSLLKQVLDELKLSQTGVVDAASAKELGKLTGVDAIIAGTITDLGESIAMNCRLIETQSGEVFAAAKSRFIKDRSIEKLLGGVYFDKSPNKNGDEQTISKKLSLVDDMSIPSTLDASKYVMKYPYNNLYCELISFTLAKTTILKLFVGNDNDSVFYNVVLDLPLLTDEKGEQYSLKKIEGQNLEISPYDKNKRIIKSLPAKGKLRLVCEFEPVLKSVKKLWLTFMDKQIEIDWQELLKNK